MYPTANPIRTTSIPRSDDIQRRPEPEPLSQASSKGYKAQAQTREELRKQMRQQQGWI